MVGAPVDPTGELETEEEEERVISSEHGGVGAFHVVGTADRFDEDRPYVLEEYLVSTYKSCPIV